MSNHCSTDEHFLHATDMRCLYLISAPIRGVSSPAFSLKQSSMRHDGNKRTHGAFRKEEHGYGGVVWACLTGCVVAPRVYFPITRQSHPMPRTSSYLRMGTS